MSTKYIFIITIFISIIFFSCSTTTTTTRTSTNTTSLTIPTGWNILDKKLIPSYFTHFLIKEDYSSALTLQSLYNVADDSLMIIGNVSLRSKLAEEPSRRATKVPTVWKKGSLVFSTYTYIEQGLLRRVMVFRKENTYYELELLQLKDTEPFENLIEIQTTFAQQFCMSV